MRARIIIFLLIIGITGLHACLRMEGAKKGREIKGALVDITGLVDPCLANEARYLRHLSITEPSIPFQDFPGAFDYLPSSFCFSPPRIRGR